jgi:hypothetical protein
MAIRLGVMLGIVTLLRHPASAQIRLHDGNHDGVLVVACVGDSNTWDPDHDRWCSLVARKVKHLPVDGQTLPVRFVNYSFWGAPLCETPRVDLFPPTGKTLVRFARSDHADVVILAMGTNDFQRLEVSPPRFLHCLDTVVRHNPGMGFFVATIPQLYDPHVTCGERIREANADLVAAGYAVIDFDHGFPMPLFLADGVHLGREGQELRAKRVIAALKLATN